MKLFHVEQLAKTRLACSLGQIVRGDPYLLSDAVFRSKSFTAFSRPIFTRSGSLIEQLSNHSAASSALGNRTEKALAKMVTQDCHRNGLHAAQGKEFAVTACLRNAVVGLGQQERF